MLTKGMATEWGKHNFWNIVAQLLFQICGASDLVRLLNPGIVYPLYFKEYPVAIKKPQKQPLGRE
jgi:hypothetical protein